jgi:PhnB protein
MSQTTPAGYHSVTPYLVVKDTAAAIEFYKRAFGAEELDRMAGPGGKGIIHAEIRIGDSRMMLSDEFPGAGAASPESLGGTTCQMFLYVPDVDSAFEQAISAGAISNMPPADMFWGDRYGKLIDPFGHQWAMATHVEDVSPQEAKKRADAFFAQMSRSRLGGGA